MPLSTTNKKLCSELEGNKNQILCKEWETSGSSALNRHSPSSPSNRCSENSAEEEEERTLRPGGWRTSWKKVSLTHCWQTSQELTEVEAACTELSLVWYKVLYCYIITSSLGFLWDYWVFNLVDPWLVYLLIGSFTFVCLSSSPLMW